MLFKWALTSASLGGGGVGGGGGGGGLGGAGGKRPLRTSFAAVGAPKAVVKKAAPAIKDDNFMVEVVGDGSLHYRLRFVYIEVSEWS
jgi:hypothetical protein